MNSGTSPADTVALRGAEAGSRPLLQPAQFLLEQLVMLSDAFFALPLRLLP